MYILAYLKERGGQRSKVMFAAQSNQLRITWDK